MQNRLVCKQRLNHLGKLAKWLSRVVSTYLYGSFACMFLSCHTRVLEWIHTQSCLNFKELLAQNKHEIWSSSDCNRTGTHDQLVCKRTLNHLANNWAGLWILICTVYLIVRSCQATYVFQSESTLYSCLNVKEPLAWNRRWIWSSSDGNGTGTHNHLVLTRTLNHLAKLAKSLSRILSTYLYGAFDCMFLSCHLWVSEWINSL